MPDDTGERWITYNREIYNADELRYELERKGFTFRSRSDTEVVLKGYAAWGEGVIERLRGMFAFGIWDETRNMLLLVRDRLGIKPLYYAVTGNHLVFASELRALASAGLVSRDLSPRAVSAFLLLGSVPSPLTIYADVLALPPSHLLMWRPGEGIQVRPFWRFPEPQIADKPLDEILEELRAHLQEAVRIRLVSDVPLGAFLSGGLDSSTVVALMRQVGNGTIRTCSIAFVEGEYNETSYARAVAHMMETEHIEHVVTGEQVRQKLDHILWAMDQPTIDGVNTYFVSKVARDAGLKVTLSGLGGDELFAGYTNTFLRVPQLAHQLGLLQAIAGASQLLSLILHRMAKWHGRDDWAKAADAIGRFPPLAAAYVARRGLFAPSHVKRLLSGMNETQSEWIFDPWKYLSSMSFLDGRDKNTLHSLRHAELRVYTHNQLLRDTDTMSMAHSLEVRVPLLDHRLVEYVATIPEQYLLGKGPKPLLRMTMKDLLPSMVADRADKRGFVFPFAHWLRTDLRKKVEDAFNNNAILNGWLDKRQVLGVWDSFLSGRTHWTRPWALAVLLLWAQVQEVSE